MATLAYALRGLKLNYMSETSESSDDESRVLVIDTGSYYLKAGFVGDDIPRAVFPTVISVSNSVMSRERDITRTYDAVAERARAAGAEEKRLLRNAEERNGRT